MRKDGMAARRKADFQRSAVYKWERSLFPIISDNPADQRLSLSACADLIAAALGEFGMKRMPHIADGRGTSWARGGAKRINLPLWSRSVPVVLHEAAHCIVRRRDNGVSAHGPLFMAVYIRLLAKLHGQEEAALRASAESAGLLVRSTP